MTHIIKVSDEVLYTGDSILELSATDISALKTAALQNPRKRIRLCSHRDTGARVHEMLIVHMKGCYVRPHKHVARTESFHVIEGTADIVVFDDDGMVRQVVSMGPYGSGRAFYYRLDEALFHTLFVTSEFFVFHETTAGPFTKADTVFASWAPAETDHLGAERFARETALAAGVQQ
jgi:cupin fold WbuC family metalloprotein